MIPPFDEQGRLPPGVHRMEWQEFAEYFGVTPYRQLLIAGLLRALKALRLAHCKVAYIDGSFSTSKEIPEDFDACWSMDGVDPNLLDPVLLDFSNGRLAQKTKFLGELFPCEVVEGRSSRTFFDFFQIDKETGEPKGIIALDLRRLS